MRAITVCQPWAWLIAEGYKPVENRPSPFQWRGMVNTDVAIHAGLSREFFTDHAWSMVRHAEREKPAHARLTGPSELVYGAVVAVAYVRAVVSAEAARTWFKGSANALEYIDGPWCIILERVRKLAAPVACRGYQGAWVVPPDVARNVIGQVVGAAKA